MIKKYFKNIYTVSIGGNVFFPDDLLKSRCSTYDRLPTISCGCFSTQSALRLKRIIKLGSDVTSRPEIVEMPSLLAVKVMTNVVNVTLIPLNE